MKGNTVSGQGQLDKETLRSVAGFQKGVLFSILGQIVAVIILMAGGQSLPPMVTILVQGLAALSAIAGMVFVLLLALKIYSPVVAVLLAILALAPCIGLICLLVINGKATGILKSHGIKVGLLGANISSI